MIFGCLLTLWCNDGLYLIRWWYEYLVLDLLLLTSSKSRVCSDDLLSQGDDHPGI